MMAALWSLWGWLYCIVQVQSNYLVLYKDTQLDENAEIDWVRHISIEYIHFSFSRRIIKWPLDFHLFISLYVSVCTLYIYFMLLRKSRTGLDYKIPPPMFIG